ncbi:hypothetical protein HDC94_002531 [Leifsonia sp. AK011]|uniref:hypothetical protein n=1 Tax=Leifsonia sp. AK011 TaxID=2723075 RepID=UPI0015C8B18F|nr:hypothetical protein [Leifsonia sp. AK011]NYF11375.1 hypothetical protein [Leifsonia sp. AK011]
MKKTLAAIGASVLGLGSVAAGAALPASAASGPTEGACADIQDQIEATGNITDNWFQDCVPQYGIGKAEFTIVPDENNPSEEFPEGFVDLTAIEDPSLSVTSTLDMAAISQYFAGIEAPDVVSPIFPLEIADSTPTSRTYASSVFAPITSIGLATDVPAAVTAACSLDTAEYDGGWVATYAPIDTTFSQTIDGKAWNYTITGTPKPSYFFVGTDTSTFCVTDGEYTLTDEGEGTGVVQALFGGVFTYIPGSIDESLTELQSLGVFSRDGLVPPPAPAPAPAPQLAATGADAASLAPVGLLAAGVLAAGGALVTLGARRKRRNA